LQKQPTQAQKLAKKPAAKHEAHQASDQVIDDMTVQPNRLFPPITMRPCNHWDERPDASDICLIVIHNISLPPGQFGTSSQNTPYIDDFFGGRLDCTLHPYFQQLQGVRVSAHCVIYRDGRVWQYVPFEKRAWHAGVSQYQGREKCNDFSIGIELEGTDDTPFTPEQYQALTQLCHALMQQYPLLSVASIVGHSDIAPGRKTDPGPAFNWSDFLADLTALQHAGRIQRE
jgi:N-acetyl-anhydromuramoyl-L-alanine amidase